VLPLATICCSAALSPQVANVVFLTGDSIRVPDALQRETLLR